MHLHDWNILLQITYSVPYALVSARIEALGLGQGGNFRMLWVQNFSSEIFVAELVTLTFTFCRAVNGRPESGNSDPTGIIAILFVCFGTPSEHIHYTVGLMHLTVVACSLTVILSCLCYLMMFYSILFVLSHDVLKITSS